MSHIIPFPKRSDLSNIPDFPTGRHVLAVYPETTALYKATVCQTRKVFVDAYCSHLPIKQSELTTVFLIQTAMLVKISIL